MDAFAAPSYFPCSATPQTMDFLLRATGLAREPTPPGVLVAGGEQQMQFWVKSLVYVKHGKKLAIFVPAPLSYLHTEYPRSVVNEDMGDDKGVLHYENGCVLGTLDFELAWKVVGKYKFDAVVAFTAGHSVCRCPPSPPPPSLPKVLRCGGECLVCREVWFLAQTPSGVLPREAMALMGV